MVRIEDIDKEKGYFYVIVPAWNPTEVVRLRLEDVPTEIQSRVMAGQIRFHAHVNIGAESNEDLYFEGWEVD